MRAFARDLWHYTVGCTIGMASSGTVLSLLGFTFFNPYTLTLVGLAYALGFPISAYTSRSTRSTP